MRIRAFLLLVVCVQFLFAASWVLGLGGGNSQYLGVDSLSAPGTRNVLVVQNGWRVEAEAGYYAGQEGFDVIAVYGETFWRSQTRQTLFRDQHLALLGEYRLFVVTMDERFQFAPGLGLSLRRLDYYSEDAKGHEPLYLAVDAEIAGIFFATNHFMLRSQATYSFAPRYPLYGTISITLRLGYRS